MTAQRRPGKSPSIEMVARQAGVSIATVSRVVNGVSKKASADTTERVRRVIAELGYRPSGAGSALRSRQSRIVALLVPGAASAYMAAVAAAVEAALRERQKVMILCDTAEDANIQDDYLLEMRAQMVRGMVMLGAVDSPVLTQFLDEGEPLVFVNRKSPGGPGGGFVGIDNLQAGADIAAYFVERERLPCAVIHADPSSSATAERLTGFRRHMKREGIKLPASAIKTYPSVDHLEIGYRGAVALLQNGRVPRSIFCASDLIAYGAHRRCRELGLAVPEDVLLFGFDDNPLNDWVAPWLDTVHVPYETFGTAVVDLLDTIWAGTQTQPAPEILLPHKMVLRA